MCDYCKQQVKEMDIRDSDLPNLPFTLKKHLCIVPGCNNGVIVRDYGIAPYYYWPVKQKVWPDRSWRGGWFDVSGHYHMCSKHRKMIKKRQIEVPERTPEINISKIIPHNGQSRKKAKGW